MKKTKYPKREDWAGLLARPVMDFSEIEQRVAPVLQEVKANGDAAVRKFTKQFDKADLASFEVSGQELKEAVEMVDDDLKNAIKIAKNNIEKFHVIQKELVKKVETMPGVVCWRRSVPIEKVGLYIPGGTAPLFSSVLMLGIPAGLAGCHDVVLCTPPGPQGKVNPVILYAAQMAGIDRIFKVGGAQAIAAMAYGTETIPAVYKIFGPGNQYVTAAKQLVTREGVAIDMPAGPSEVLVMADDTAKPSFLAADLLSQAEHGTDSQVVFITTSEKMLEATGQEVERQLADLPRKEIAAAALANSTLVLVKDLQEAADMINLYAPEHLILAMENAEAWSVNIVNAGSVFLGHYTPESAGDYASGTNHTLPTDGFAKVYSGVSLDSFIKKITFQQLTQTGILQLGDTVEKMAEAEQLEAHKRAVSVRLDSLKKS